MKLLIMLFSPPSSHSIALWSKYSPQHPVLEHPQFMFLSVRDNVPHPYRTTGKIIVLYILTFIFFDSRREDLGQPVCLLCLEQKVIVGVQSLEDLHGYLFIDTHCVCYGVHRANRCSCCRGQHRQYRSSTRTAIRTSSGVQDATVCLI
jgi:hypothetical protein